MLDCLKTYVNMGWPLFPCYSQNLIINGKQKAKTPLTAHGHKDASLDWKQIEEWYKQYPNCAWGVATSAERCVLDIDTRKGGLQSYADLIHEFGKLPATPRVSTGSGGYHYWFRAPAGTRCHNGLYTGIDRKAEGGYVIVPPSKIDIPEHEGRAYEWLDRPWEMAFAEAPAWLITMKPKTEAKGKTEAKADDPWIVQPACSDLLTHPGCKHGQRRLAFCQLAGVHLSRSDSEASIRAMAEAWAMRCEPTFDGKPDANDHWEIHLHGLMCKEQAKAEKMTTTPTPHPVSFSAEMFVPEAGRKQINSEAQAESELVCFLPPSAENEQGGDKVLSTETPLAPPEPPGCPPHDNGNSADRQAGGSTDENWPTLPADAYHGLLGEMLTAISPQTEADPSGILLGWLCCFGNIVGRGAWFQVGPRRHHPALYLGIVGISGGGKADCGSTSLWPFRAIETAWAGQCIANGVGSGEGLVERIADPQQTINKKGEVEIIPGATDKRCLLRLSELSVCFKKGRRENATLSEHLREAWDGEPIHVPNRKGNALSASDYSVSVYGDVTPGYLRKTLETGTEGVDGFANRFLWAALRNDTADHPHGGNIDVLKPYLERLQSALAFAKQAGALKRDADADRLWESVYSSLKRSGNDVPHTDRARPYVVRLAMLYALADCSNTIKVEHLKAALAVWNYCRQSAKLIFGQGTTEVVADPLWLRLMNAIAKAPGISRTGLRDVIGTRIKAEEIDAALAHLERSGMAYKRMVQPEGGGRRAEHWYPGKPDGNGDGRSVEDDNPTSLPVDPWIVQADADTGRKQTNSADDDACCHLATAEPEGSALALADEAEAGVSLFPSHASGKADGEGSELVCFLPEADGMTKAEERWLCHDVLPSIRKTGRYDLHPLTPAERLLEQAKMAVEQERNDPIIAKLDHAREQYLAQKAMNAERIVIENDVAEDAKGVVQIVALEPKDQEPIPTLCPEQKAENSEGKKGLSSTEGLGSQPGSKGGEKEVVSHKLPTVSHKPLTERQKREHEEWLKGYEKAQQERIRREQELRTDEMSSEEFLAAFLAGTTPSKNPSVKADTGAFL